eukprot:jgi/Botrbrau1/3556/Bobra.0078s0013.1
MQWPKAKSQNQRGSNDRGKGFKGRNGHSHIGCPVRARRGGCLCCRCHWTDRSKDCAGAPPIRAEGCGR